MSEDDGFRVRPWHVMRVERGCANVMSEHHVAAARKGEDNSREEIANPCRQRPRRAGPRDLRPRTSCSVWVRQDLLPSSGTRLPQPEHEIVDDVVCDHRQWAAECRLPAKDVEERK